MYNLLLVTLLLNPNFDIESLLNAEYIYYGQRLYRKLQQTVCDKTYSLLREEDPTLTKVLSPEGQEKLNAMSNCIFNTLFNDFRYTNFNTLYIQMSTDVRAAAIVNLLVSALPRKTYM